MITINYYIITMAIARVNILLDNDRHARVRTWERLLFLGFQVLIACAVRVEEFYVGQGERRREKREKRREETTGPMEKKNKKRSRTDKSRDVLPPFLCVSKWRLELFLLLS